MDDQSLAAMALYVGLNGLILLVLAYNVGSRRGAQGQLQPGDLGDAKLLRAIRAHGNFAEHAPMVLLLLMVLAMLGIESLWLHVFGATFTIGRVIGAFGMMRDRHPNAFRFAGNLATGLALLIGSAALVWSGIAYLV